jgi:hypothetical protein
MRILAIAAILIVALPAELLAQEPKKDAPFQLLRFGDLGKLNGSWEMKVDLPSGWQGTIDLFIQVNGPGGKLDGACGLRYSATLMDQQGQRIQLINALAPGQIVTAGIKQGNVVALVSRGKEKKGDLPGLTDIDPRPELTTPFQLDGDKLTLDMSKSKNRFLPTKLAALDLDFAKLLFTRSKKPPPGK